MTAFETITTDINGDTFTAESFLNYLRRSNPVWWDEESNVSPWVFRGHSDANWKLIPSAFRELDANKLKPLIEKVKQESRFQVKHITSMQPGVRDATFKFIAFYTALQEFYKLSLELGLTDEIITLDDPFGVVGACWQTDGAKEFYQLCSSEIVALAQHHSIPTPCLDWTKKPEVAAHFAAQLDADRHLSDIAVYAIHCGKRQTAKHPKLPRHILTGLVESEKGFMIKLPVDFLSSIASKNPYLRAQHGILTLSGSVSQFFEEGVCTPLEHIYGDVQGIADTLLKKIILSKSEVGKLRELLDREGLTEAHLKPTLDKVAETVCSRWGYD